MSSFYIKEVSIIVAAGFFGNSASHGISNAYTNDRIIDVRCRGLETSDTYTGGEDLSYYVIGINIGMILHCIFRED